MEKDQKETERIVKGIVAKEVQSDIEILKQKIKDAESDSKIKQEKVIWSLGLMNPIVHCNKVHEFVFKCKMLTTNV